jgi:large subunit ribosomal protein L21
MYAVIETGGKQYRVEVGTELHVELLDVQPGESITLDRVLLVADGDQASIGQPLVTDAVVSAEVLRQDRGEKLISFKYRPKARSRVKKGHRQELTVLRVTDVRLGGRSAADEVRAADAEAKSERERLQEAAARQAAADAALAAKLAESRPAEAPTSATLRRRGKAATEESAEGESPVNADAAAEAHSTAEAEVTSETETAAPARSRTRPAKAATEAAQADTTAADATTTTTKKARAPRAKATSDDSGSEPTGEDA